MDLGAVLCRPASPHCAACPLEATCAWRGVGTDPALGSAGVSRFQARFDGSDRQARGRLMKFLGDGPVGRDRLAVVMGCDLGRAERLAGDLCDEGLIVGDGDSFRLP
jgi:A/G-specific adenine glycosylase